MSIIEIRRVITAAACAICLVSFSVEAQQVRKDKDTESSMACSNVCGKKHGTGKVKNKAYDRNAYESCMVECMRDANAASRKQRQK